MAAGVDPCVASLELGSESVEAANLVGPALGEELFERGHPHARTREPAVITPGRELEWRG